MSDGRLFDETTQSWAVGAQAAAEATEAADWPEAPRPSGWPVVDVDELVRRRLPGLGDDPDDGLIW